MRDIGYRGRAVFELDASTDPVGNLRNMRSLVETNPGHIYR